MVRIHESPWHEMDVNGELTLKCTDKFCQAVERCLRMTLYQWNHLCCDMIVEPIFYSALVVQDSGFGIEHQADIADRNEHGGIRSLHFNSQIDSEKDIEKIKMPQLTYDKETTERNYQTLVQLIGDILEIRKRGIVTQWFVPWDVLIQWCDIQKVLMDLFMRPKLVHAALDRLLKAYLCRIEQWRELNVLSYGEGNFPVGSGAFGYTKDLPAAGFDPQHVRTIDQWGSATAQIFSEVSPDMHVEFALQYERRWLDQFGLTYYGCCEPLHNKIDILKTIPNLRKISVSPWADVDKMVDRTNGNYVLSVKPNPAVLATHEWHPEQARSNLVNQLEKAKGCAVEVVMKDIMTVRHEPQRLWEWALVAMDVVERL